MNNKIEKKIRRKKRIRKDIAGSINKPRLSVYRSNSHIYAQIIDDINMVTLVSSSDFLTKTKGNKSDIAKEVGKSIAALALKKGIKTIVFDRSGNKYHGRVKALADGAREGGLLF